MTKRRQKTTSKPHPEEINVRSLLWLFPAIVVLQIVGLAVASRLTWGFGFWNVISPRWAYPLLGIGLLLLVPSVNRSVSSALANLTRSASKALARFPALFSGAVSSVLLLALFYVFRSRALVYGDGYLIRGEYSSAAQLFSNVEIMKPLSAPFHQVLYRVISAVVDLSPSDTISLISAIGGVIGFWAIYRLAGLLTEDKAGKWFLLFAAMSSGSVMLFFGYVENYTWATAVGLWSLALSIGYVKGRSKLWYAVLLAVIATAFHVAAIVFLAAAALAWVVTRNASFGIQPSRVLKLTALLAVAGSLAIAFLVQVTPVRDYLVLVWPIAENPYWMLSPAHLADMVNVAVLVAPFAVVAVLFFPVLRKLRKPEQPEYYILAATALLAFIASFWINPELGAPRDWDLLSIFGLPASLWGARRILVGFAGVQARSSAVFGAVAVCAICIVPNVIEKNNVSLAVNKLDPLLWEDPHYQVDYKRADRCEPWAYTLYYEAGTPADRTIKYYERALKADPSSYMTWFNVGNMFKAMGDMKSAYRSLVRSVQINPNDLRPLSNLSKLEMQMDLFDDAVKHAQMAAKLDPNHPIVQTDLGIALSLVGNSDGALQAFRRAYTLDPSSWEYKMNLGLGYANVGQDDSALTYLRVVLTPPPHRPPKASVYASLAEVAIAERQFSIAEQAIKLYRTSGYSQERLQELTQKLQQAMAASK
jgi:Flp pilus assembly protein TadD